MGRVTVGFVANRGIGTVVVGREVDNMDCKVDNEGLVDKERVVLGWDWGMGGCIGEGESTGWCAG